MSHCRASFSIQANALLRKNFTFQKRNIKENVRLVLFPFLICVLLVLIQALINSTLDSPKYRCGCTCVDKEGEGRCRRVCGIEYSTLDQAGSCSIPNPPEWPALLQIPAPEYRAANTDLLPFKDLPNESCRRTGSCPAVLLFTGINQSFGEGLALNFFSDTFSLNTSDIAGSVAYNVLGTSSKTATINFLDPAFSSSLPIYYMESRCVSNSTFAVPIRRASIIMNKETKCVQATPLWKNGSSEINDELYKGYRKGNDGRKINEIITAYDFLNTNQRMFNVTIWYNSTYKNDTGSSSIALVRVPRLINLVSNAYLQFLQGRGTKILLDFVKEMPKAETVLRLDISSLLGTLFFTWVVLQLFPVVLTSLVYERQQNLRIMMKMHGLGDGPYWMISYAYFLLISFAYMICFVVFGSAIGLKFFTLNDYSIQFVFYFIYINLQLSLAFLMAGLFSNVKTASVVAYIFVFGTGLLGGFLFQFFLEDDSFPRGWIIVMELYPGFSLYRGLYEFAQYSFTGNFMGTDGMLWKDLNDNANGMKVVLIIMFLEWLFVLCSAFYMDQGLLSRRGLFSCCAILRERSATLRKSSFKRQGSEVRVPLEKDDVIEEMEKVEHFLREPHTDYAIICDNLQKVYHGKDGNPGKFAVRSLYLALLRGECFGMLGPNGAGKTSFINMMIGLTKPTTGTALVNGLDIGSQMSEIYSSMGVCPQHDLLWETLTGREHLLFYGRLKNLKGRALTLAVEESLRSVNLFYGGVADRQTGKYSGGMKRRLSVAISLIGDPKVVYMDEPSTGLDPASRNNLWNVVKRAKRYRAIILTTHSMEEAEVLCDRLGIFVDGSFQCIGNPRELKARYGGSYVFTMTTSPENDEEVAKVVCDISQSAKRVYHISGTQKFELAKHEVRMADVFRAVENAKSQFVVHAWGIADTTLEDVFIKVARGAQAFNPLS